MSNLTQNQYQPDVVSPPGDTLQELLDERGMTQADLALRTGRPKKTINQIIKGKAAITPDTAFQFERVLGTPASFWNNRERIYAEWQARKEASQALSEHIPWMKKFPILAMARLGWITRYDDPIAQLEGLLRYFGVASPIIWQNVWQGAQVAYRQSPAFAVDPASVTAWLRRGELQAHEIDCAPYRDDKFRGALSDIRALTVRPVEGILHEVKEICAESGVAVAFTPELPGIHTSGATRWLSPVKASMMLSFRYKTNDHFWFTFFHEAAHILLHGKRDVFLESDHSLDDELGVKEREADRFAADFLIPPADYQILIKSVANITEVDIVEFAERIGIAPGIVVGRLQHDEVIPMKALNQLKQRLEWQGDEITKKS